MSSPIGYATLQIIPSLDGVSEAIDRQLGGQLRTAGRDGGRQLARGVGDGLQNLEREVEKATKAYDKLKDKAADALGKVRSEEAKLARLRESGASTDRIVAAEERLNTARRNSTRANREAEDSHRGLLTAQRSLADGTGDLGRRFGGLSDLAGSAGKAIAGAGVVAAGAAVVGIGALAAGVVVAGKALYDLGAEFDDVFDNIRVKTGATGPALEQLQAATERLSTKVPLSIGEIGNVVAETSRALHLTGPELDNTSRAIANLGRLMGEDVDVRALGKAFRGFGVDAKDQVPALDSLLQASQTTGVGVNELLATIVKGGAGLRQFGFGFGESAALATQFEDAGLDADKAMGGLTKGLAALAKDGQTGQDALRGNVDQIKSLIAAGNDAAALDLTNKLFGAKGGVQFFEAIKNGALDLDALASSVGNTGDTIAQAAADTDDWAERWELFKNSIKVGLQPVATGVFDAVNDKLTQLADWVDKHKPEVIEFFTDLASTITTKTAEALHGISMFISQGLVPILRAVEDFGKNNFLANFIPGAEELGGAAGMLADGLAKIPGPLDAASRSVAGLVPNIETLGQRTADAQRFVGALGDATASLPDGKTIELSSNAPEVIDSLKAVGIEVVTLPDGKISVTANTDEGRRIIQAFRDQETKAPITPTVRPQIAFDGVDVSIGNYFKNLRPVLNPQLPPGWGGGGGNFDNALNRPGQSSPGPVVPGAGAPRRAAGGAISGPGGPTSDVIPFMGSNGEHVFDALDVQLMGGQAAVYAFRAALKAGTAMRGHATGGAIGPDVAAAQDLAGTKYSQGNRTDCSGMVARVINAALGQGGGGLMSTKNAEEWLAARGFVRGTGGPGQISVGWYDHGPNPNDGHMAMTLSDGTNAEAGGKNGVFTLGAGASGANSPQFDQHMFLPNLFGEGPSGGVTGFSGGSSSGGGVAPGVGPNGESGTYSAPDPKAVREADQKVADADVRVREAEAKQRELEADAKESQKISAQADVDKAKREAADARADADEARRGKFTPGKDGGSGGTPLGLKLPSAFSGLASIGLDGLGFTTQASPDSPARTFDFGNALGAGVAGQVSSALDVFGVGDAPPLLQAASTLIGGITIGGKGGAVSPLSVNGSGTGTLLPDGQQHGLLNGQAPGPAGDTVVINARDTEDAFIKYQRQKDQKANSQLSRF